MQLPALDNCDFSTFNSESIEFYNFMIQLKLIIILEKYI